MANGNGGNGGRISPADFRRALQASQSVLGRFTGPELFYTQNVALTAAGGPLIVNMPRTLNLNRPLTDIWIDLSFRAAVTVGAYASVSPEAPQNILQRIQVQGIHKDFGNLTPIYITGATAFLWSRLFQARGHGTCLIAVGGAPTGGQYAADYGVDTGAGRTVSGGRPMVPPFIGTVANHDVRLVWRIPVYPLMGIGQELKKQCTNFAWQAKDWADTLQLQLTFGDATALGDTTGATVAFTAFGSASGSPSLSIHLGYTLMGQFSNMVRSGVCIRTEQPTSQQQTALTTAAVLQTLQKQITTGVLVKSGTIQTTGLTAGVDTLATLSDLQLERTQIQVDNKPVRNNQSNIVAKAHAEAYFDAVHPQGYLWLPFNDGQSALLSYRGDGLAGGSQFQLVSDVIAASANNRQRYVQEMIYGGPFPAQR